MQSTPNSKSKKTNLDPLTWPLAGLIPVSGSRPATSCRHVAGNYEDSPRSLNAVADIPALPVRTCGVQIQEMNEWRFA